MIQENTLENVSDNQESPEKKKFLISENDSFTSEISNSMQP
jgi:hypothetical protein